MNPKYPAKSIYNEIDIDFENDYIDNLDIDETIDNYDDLYRIVKDAYLDSIRSNVWD